MIMKKPNFPFHFLMLPLLLLLVVFDISNSAPTTALALRKASTGFDDDFGSEKAAGLGKTEPKADWMKNDIGGKESVNEKEMNDGMESGQRSPSSSVGGMGAPDDDESDNRGEAEEQKFNGAKLGGKAVQMGDDASNNKKSKPFGTDAKDEDRVKSSFANEDDDHFGENDDFLQGKSQTKGRVNTLEGKYPMKGGPMEEQDHMGGSGINDQQVEGSGFPMDDKEDSFIPRLPSKSHKGIGLMKAEEKEGQPEEKPDGRMKGLSGQPEDEGRMEGQMEGLKEEGSQMVGEGQTKMESPMDVDEKKLKRKMDEEAAGRMSEAEEDPIRKKASNWDWDEPKVKDEGVQTKDDWKMNKYGQSGDNEVHDEVGSDYNSARSHSSGQLDEEKKKQKKGDEKEGEEVKLGKEEKHMTLGKEEMKEENGKDEKMMEEEGKEEKEDELKEEEGKKDGKNEGDVKGDYGKLEDEPKKGDYGKPEEEEGKNDKKDGEEEEEEEEEDPKFFKIYPFLHGASPQSIKVFRDLLKDQQLSKAQLDVKRKEWAEQQPKDIQTSFSAWKQHLDEKKKKRVEKIEHELPTLAKGTQQLYFEIKAVIANQGISRHQECGQIRDFVNAVDEKVRNEFKEKAETRVVKFCMEEEEPELAANGDAEHHTAEEHAAEGDEKKQPIEELDGQPKAMEEGTGGALGEVGALAKIGDKQQKENENADENMVEKTMDEKTMEQEHQQEKTEEGGHVDHFEEPKDEMMFPAPISSLVEGGDHHRHVETASEK